MKAISLADKIVSFAEDGTRAIDRSVAAWPAEFQAIIWDAVAVIAVQRAKAARDAHVEKDTLSDIQLAAGVAALRNVRTKFNGNATDGAIVYAVYFAVLEATLPPQS